MYTTHLPQYSSRPWVTLSSPCSRSITVGCPSCAFQSKLLVCHTLGAPRRVTMWAVNHGLGLRDCSCILFDDPYPHT